VTRPSEEIETRSGTSSDHLFTYADLPLCISDVDGLER
jgi:hypothetical protein